MFAAEINCVC